MPRTGVASRASIRAAQRAIALAPTTGEWSDALEKVAHAAGGRGCHLNCMAPDLGVISSRLGGITQDEVREFSKRQGASPIVNLRAAAIYDAPLMQVTSESDFTTSDEWTQSTFFQDFLTKIDAPYSVFGKLFESGKDSTCVTVLRSKKQGHASDEDKRALALLLPGLRDAVALQRSLDDRAFEIAATGLDYAGIPAIYCDAHLRLISTSDAGERALSHGGLLSVQNGKIRLQDGNQQRRLLRAVSLVSKNDGLEQPHTRLLLNGASGCAPKVLAVTPISDGLTSVFGGRALLLLFDEHNTGAVFASDHAKLTSSEVDIGKLLVRGQTTTEIAQFRSVSRATVQTQIKAMGAKLSSRHRAELLIALQNWFRQ
jgi:DNA-binding CsgD family transcriptional regulator